MRIGLFYQIQVPKPWTPSSESQRIYEALEQIPYAEQQGFDKARSPDEADASDDAALRNLFEPLLAL